MQGVIQHKRESQDLPTAKRLHQMAEAVKNEALADVTKVFEVISDKEIVKIADFRVEIIKKLKEYDEGYGKKKK